MEGAGCRSTLPPGFPSFLGGDPSAGSPTDTLLRLNPPRRRQAQQNQTATHPLRGNCKGTHPITPKRKGAPSIYGN